MTREDALPYVGYVVDDAGGARDATGDEPIVRGEDMTYAPVLVGWHRPSTSPLFVAVYSYLDVELEDEEAEELAREYLAERGWFAGAAREADYIIR